MEARRRPVGARLLRERCALRYRRPQQGGRPQRQRGSHAGRERAGPLRGRSPGHPPLRRRPHRRRSRDLLGHHDIAHFDLHDDVHADEHDDEPHSDEPAHDDHADSPPHDDAHYDDYPDTGYADHNHDDTDVGFDLLDRFEAVINRFEQVMRLREQGILRLIDERTRAISTESSRLFGEITERLSAIDGEVSVLRRQSGEQPGREGKG
ncbi:hypothetical protein [Streptomyces sp. NPDC002057]|uniref:hypothetical protein n=1 Tax=Streptomyces sp. NPDC002057 TaxID=3154664 RepID=UPI0033239CB4